MNVLVIIGQIFFGVLLLLLGWHWALGILLFLLIPVAIFGIIIALIFPEER